MPYDVESIMREAADAANMDTGDSGAVAVAEPPATDNSGYDVDAIMREASAPRQRSLEEATASYAAHGRTPIAGQPNAGLLNQFAGSAAEGFGNIGAGMETGMRLLASAGVPQMGHLSPPPVNLPAPPAPLAQPLIDWGHKQQELSMATPGATLPKIIAHMSGENLPYLLPLGAAERILPVVDRTLPLARRIVPQMARSGVENSIASAATAPEGQRGDAAIMGGLIGMGATGAGESLNAMIPRKAPEFHPIEQSPQPRPFEGEVSPPGAQPIDFNPTAFDVPLTGPKPGEPMPPSALQPDFSIQRGQPYARPQVPPGYLEPGAPLPDLPAPLPIEPTQPIPKPIQQKGENYGEEIQSQPEASRAAPDEGQQANAAAQGHEENIRQDVLGTSELPSTQGNQEGPAGISGVRPQAPPINADLEEPVVSTGAGSPVPHAPAKEPWEMTQKEWMESGQHEKNAQAIRRAREEYDQDVDAFGENSEEAKNSREAVFLAEFNFETSDALGAHKKKIARALAKGKPVPPEVLAEYPDLIPQGAPENASEPVTPVAAAESGQGVRKEAQQVAPEENIVTNELREDLGVSREKLDAYDPSSKIYKLGKSFGYKTIEGSDGPLFKTKREAIEAATSHKKLKEQMYEKPEEYRDITSVRATKRLALMKKYQDEGMSEVESGNKARAEIPSVKSQKVSLPEKSPAAVVSELGKAQGKQYKHYTTPERAENIRRQGAFTFENDPIFGTGDFSEGPKKNRFAGNRIYLDLDGEKSPWREKIENIPSGPARDLTAAEKQVNNDRYMGKGGEVFYDYAKNSWRVIPGKKKVTKLEGVDVRISPKAKTLVLDSEKAYRQTVNKYGFLLDNPSVWGKIAKDFDVVELRNVDDIVRKTDNKFFRAARGDQAIVLNPSVVEIPKKSEPFNPPLGAFGGIGGAQIKAAGKMIAAPVKAGGRGAKVTAEFVDESNPFKRPEKIMAETPEGKEAFQHYQATKDRANEIEGPAARIYEKAAPGLLDYSQRNWLAKNFKRVYESGQRMPNKALQEFSDAWTKIHNMLGERAEKAGVEISDSAVPGGKRPFKRSIKDFFPRILTDDARTALRKQSGPVYDAIVRAGVQRGMEPMGVSEIDTLLSPERKHGSLERPRKGYIPDQVIVNGKTIKLLESDPLTVIPQYIENASRRLAVIEKWGGQDVAEETAQALSKSLKKGSERVGDTFDYLWADLQGRTPEGVFENLDKRVKKVGGTLEAAARTAQLSTAVLSNITGIVPGATKFGMRRAATDYLWAVKQSVARAAHIKTKGQAELEFMRDENAIAKDPSRHIFGTEDIHGQVGHAGDVLFEFTGMNWQNRRLNEAAARSGMLSLKSAIDYLRNPKDSLLRKSWGKDAAGIQRMLEREFRFTQADINRMANTGISKSDFGRAMRVATETTNLFNETGATRRAWMSRDILRRFTTYSSYARLMGNLLSDTMREVGHGNVGPIVRLLGSSVVTGAGVKLLKDSLFGRKKDENETLAQTVGKAILETQAGGIPQVLGQDFYYAAKRGESPNLMSAPQFEYLRKVGTEVTKALFEKIGWKGPAKDKQRQPMTPEMHAYKALVKQTPLLRLFDAQMEGPVWQDAQDAGRGRRDRRDRR